MWDKENKTICRVIRDVYKVVLQSGDEKLIDQTEEKLKYIYMSAKKMNRKLNEYANNGKLPNPNSPGWTEKHWLLTLKQCRRCWFNETTKNKNIPC